MLQIAHQPREIVQGTWPLGGKLPYGRSKEGWTSPDSRTNTKVVSSKGVATIPTCGRLLILSPALKCWGPPDGRDDVTNLPICGPLLFLYPALKVWGPP